MSAPKPVAEAGVDPSVLFRMPWTMADNTLTWLKSLIGGIKKDYRGRGVDVMMGYKTLESAIKAGFAFIDSHHELEDNLKVRAEMEQLGGQVYKRFRIYQKKL